MNPSVSVLMPVYNVERYLASAIESVLTQTYGDFEFIIVNDGSTDQSGRILRDYARRDPRIALIDQTENRGYVARLNEGLRSCRGRFVARMDGDDLCAPTRFEVQVRYLDAHPACVAVGTDAKLLCPAGIVVRRARCPTSHEAIIANIREGRPLSIIHPSVMMRKAALDHVGYYNERYAYSEDVDLFLRLASMGTLANIDKPLMRYRQRLDSVSRVYHRVQLERHQEIVAERLGRVSHSAASGWRRLVGDRVYLGAWAGNALVRGHPRIALRYLRQFFSLSGCNNAGGVPQAGGMGRPGTSSTKDP